MIADIRDKVKQFLKETVDAEGIRIVSINQTDQGWVVEAEVAEINQYLVSIRPQYRVFEKELYSVKLNTHLEISSYKRGRYDGDEQEG